MTVGLSESIIVALKMENRLRVLSFSCFVFIGARCTLKTYTHVNQPIHVELDVRLLGAEVVSAVEISRVHAGKSRALDPTGVEPRAVPEDPLAKRIGDQISPGVWLEVGPSAEPAGQLGYIDES